MQRQYTATRCPDLCSSSSTIMILPTVVWSFRVLRSASVRSVFWHQHTKVRTANRAPTATLDEIIVPFSRTNEAKNKWIRGECGTSRFPLMTICRALLMEMSIKIEHIERGETEHQGLGRLRNRAQGPVVAKRICVVAFNHRASIHTSGVIDTEGQGDQLLTRLDALCWHTDLNRVTSQAPLGRHTWYWTAYWTLFAANMAVKNKTVTRWYLSYNIKIYPYKLWRKPKKC